MKVVVNGTDATPGRPVQDWGELLAVLDEQCATQGIVLTDVSFDGVAEPAFRDPAIAGRGVASTRIDVDAASQADLLLSSVDDALRAVPPMRSAALAIAATFREYDVDRGNRDLSGFARNLGSLLELTGAIASVAGLDLSAADRPGVGNLATVTSQVEALIVARAGSDWVTVADLLDGEISTTLEQWEVWLRTLHRDLLARSAAA